MCSTRFDVTQSYLHHVNTYHGKIETSNSCKSFISYLLSHLPLPSISSLSASSLVMDSSKGKEAYDKIDLRQNINALYENFLIPTSCR